MLIRRHNNGTYSLTDLTRNDLDNLAFGACTAVVFHGSTQARSESPEWNAKRGTIMNRLERQLRRVLPDYQSDLPRERRVEVVSDSFDAEDVYQEVTA